MLTKCPECFSTNITHDDDEYETWNWCEDCHTITGVLKPDKRQGKLL